MLIINNRGKERIKQRTGNKGKLMKKHKNKRKKKNQD